MRLPLHKTISTLKKEAIIKSSVIKERQIVDEHLYSIRKK